MIMILNMFILCLLIFLYIFPAWLLDSGQWGIREGRRGSWGVAVLRLELCP